MTNFLFTTIRVSTGTNQRVAINTDFIVKISDIGLEQSYILLDDDTSEIAQEDFETLTAKLSARPRLQISEPSSDDLLKDLRKMDAEHRHDRPWLITTKPLREVQGPDGRWIKNPMFDVWTAQQLGVDK